MRPKPWEGKFKDPVRPIDFGFASVLEILERERRAMPGSWITPQQGVDPRLSQARTMLVGGVSVGPRDGREMAIYDSICMVRHRPSGKIYIVFQESMDELIRRQNDPVKFPEWLIKDPVKRTELRIHIAEVLRKPSGKYDRSWIRFLDEEADGERVFDSIAWYLRTRNIISESMYGRGG